MVASGGREARASLRRHILTLSLVALSPLAACAGRAISVSAEAGGASNGAGRGAVDAAGASADGGASLTVSAGGASTAPPCCNVVASCDAGDVRLADGEGCPTGRSCYSFVGCCAEVIRCARVEAPAVDAGSAAGAGACSLLGTWATHSAPWNGESTDNEITFKSDGELVGGTYFMGSWSLAGSTLTIENTTGLDMTCEFADHWTLGFSADCQTAPLLPIDGGCTGARRYLNGNVTLTRSDLR